MFRALILSLIFTGPAAIPAGTYGPVLNPGTPDAAVMIDGRPVQLEYVQCVPAWRAGRAIYWEDGSISC